MDASWLEVVASFAVAIGTLTLAAVAAWQMQVSKEQVEKAVESIAATERAAEATEKAAAQTARAVLESARARLDAATFRIFVEVTTPEWPPQLHPHLKKMPGGGESTLFDPQNVHASHPVLPDERFVFPKDEDKLLWFKTFVLLRNEGVGSALVAAPSTWRVAEGDTPFGDIDGQVLKPRRTGEYRPRVVLERGRSLVFEWWAGRPLKDWADAFKNPNPPNPPNPRGSVIESVGASDRYEELVHDSLYAVMAGRPVRPIPDEQGAWRLAPDYRMVGATQPTRRTRHGIDDRDDEAL